MYFLPDIFISIILDVYDYENISTSEVCSYQISVS